MLVKTKDLTSTALDYAVALSLGYKKEEINTQSGHVELPIEGELVPYFPSIYWEDGGVLLEEYKLEPMWNETEWVVEATEIFIAGATCLEAICRGVVINEIGTYVDVPEDLKTFSCSTIQ